MSSRDTGRRLRDIVENADRLILYTAGLDVEAFAADAKTVDATERCLEQITEAVVKIGPERMALIAPEVSFERVRGMGNMLRHAYDEIDLKLLFALVQTRIPELRAVCAAALDN